MLLCLEEPLVIGVLEIGSGELVKELLTWEVGLSPKLALFCLPDALEETEFVLFLESGPLSSNCVPGSPPKRGKSNEKLLLLLLLLLILLLSMELKPDAIAGVRFRPLLLSDRRLRYSRSSI